MIFVAIGTTEFSSLIKAVDDLIPTLGEEVVMQIGRSEYEPKNCEFFRYVPSLDPYYERASIVISHGGLGILTEVMERGIPLVSVDDKNQPDEHQQQLLTVFAEEKYLVWCRDEDKLMEAIEQAKAEHNVYTPPTCEIHHHITAYIDSL